MTTRRDADAPFDVAIIGCGKMGLHHAKGIQAHGAGRIIGVAALVSRWRKRRPDVQAIGIPVGVPFLVSPLMSLLQRIVSPSTTSVDLASTFSSGRYDATIAAQLIRHTQQAFRLKTQ